MHEDNTPVAGTTPPEPTGSGHEVPSSFSSAPRAETAAPAANPQPPAFPAPTGAPHPYASGAYTAPTGYAAHGAQAQAPASAFGSVPEPRPSAFGPASAPQTSAPQTSASQAPDATPREKRPGVGAGKVAAIVVAAALVGGAAGFGGSYLGSTVWQQPTTSTAQGPDSITVNNPDDATVTTAVAAKVLPSVVTIQVAGNGASGSGSGVILSEDGYVLTNTHVVTLGGEAADPTIRVTASDGRIYDATIVGTDPIYDLAVIRLEDASGLTPIEFTDSSALDVGATSIAVGAPLGLSNSVTTGIISSLNRSIQIASSALPEDAQQDAPEGGESEGGPFQFDLPGQNQRPTASASISIAVIQTDAAINPGNSGGALVDGEGRLIGINVAIATAGGNGEESGSIGVGFAIPSNIAQRVSDELIENGEATHGLLGATVTDADSDANARVAGAYIIETTPGGAAATAGLREGDVVTEFNGAPITSSTDLTAQVRAAAAGSDASLTYVRGGSTHEVDVTLGELSL